MRSVKPELARYTRGMAMGVPLFCKPLSPLSHPGCALPLCADARPCPDGWGKLEGGTAYQDSPAVVCRRRVPLTCCWWRCVCPICVRAAMAGYLGPWC
jgi:hypothetical protein